MFKSYFQRAEDQSTYQTALKFGPIQINPHYVFFNEGGVFAMVVHNPIAKGHILLCPKNNVSRYRDLETKEIFEISLATQQLTKFVQEVFKTESTTISIQEGQGAG